MSNSYQAIYDAVRSRIHGGNIAEAVEGVIRGENIGHYFDRVKTAFEGAASEMSMPSAVYRPKLSLDGNQWCALYGDDLQSGVAGFGSSPYAAMRDFDRAWFEATQ